MSAEHSAAAVPLGRIVEAGIAPVAAGEAVTLGEPCVDAFAVEPELPLPTVVECAVHPAANTTAVIVDMTVMIVGPTSPLERRIPCMLPPRPNRPSACVS
jgi:hypothetical protein